MVKMGDVWDRAIEFLGDNAGVLLPILLLALFVPETITGSLEEVRRTGGQGVRTGLGLVTLLFAILSLWAQLAIAALAIDPTLGRRASGVATARLLPAIGVYLLLLLALFALSVPLIALIVAAGIDVAGIQAGTATMPAISPGIALAMLGYCIVYLIVVLFVGARMATLTGVIVAERRGAGAIARAFALTRGLTWKLVGVIILYAVVATVAGLAVRTVFGSILKLVAGGSGPITVAGVITAMAVAAVSSIFTVLAAAFCAKLYVAVVRAAETALPSSDLPPA